MVKRVTKRVPKRRSALARAVSRLRTRIKPSARIYRRKSRTVAEEPTGGDGA